MGMFFFGTGIILAIIGGWQGYEALGIWPVENGTVDVLAMHVRDITMDVAGICLITGALFICTGALLLDREPAPPID